MQALSEPLQVLLVEDNAGDARLLELMLAEAPAQRFRVERVARLGQALERLYRVRADVVILDLALPDAEGVGMLGQINALAPGIPVVVLTGRDDEATALEAMQCGAQDFLIKGQGDGNLIARSLRYAVERARADERLAFLAHYDHLTGLANRALFRDRLEHAVARARRDGRPMAVMFMDLDRFKAVNDTLGHDVGDALLKAVAARLGRCVRESDTVARLGGDEFTVILEGLEAARGAAAVARKILYAMQPPFSVQGQEIFATPSIGIAVYPECGESAEELCKNADTAMYRAKEQGRNGFRFYTADMGEQAQERLVMERSLRRALEHGEFTLAYQPRVDLASGAVIAAEALLRWTSPELGVVPPASFVPLCEETGLIGQVGEWVLRSACAQNRAWQDAGYAPVRVAVNVSPRQFRQAGFADLVEEILEETGLAPGCLELELTESLFVDDAAGCGAAIARLKGRGVGVSVDDFGTGYSSLRTLKRFPLDSLKIDRSLVRDLHADDRDAAAIASAVISIAHHLHLGVIAEGVETAEQLAFLRERGCESAQGHYFGEPLPAEAFARRFAVPGAPAAGAGIL